MSSELYEKFMALHPRDGGLVLPNAWDGLSALMLADAGFEAIATSSVAPAATLGGPDGRHEVLALGYPDPKKQYSNPISRFDADELFTFV